MLWGNAAQTLPVTPQKHIINCITYIGDGYLGWIMDISAIHVEGKKIVTLAGVVNASHESLSIIACVWGVFFSIAISIPKQCYAHFRQ